MFYNLSLTLLGGYINPVVQMKVRLRNLSKFAQEGLDPELKSNLKSKANVRINEFTKETVFPLTDFF